MEKTNYNEKYSGKEKDIKLQIYISAVSQPDLEGGTGEPASAKQKETIRHPLSGKSPANAARHCSASGQNPSP